MLNSKAQLSNYANQLKYCFYNDDLLGLRIFIFIITGMLALWFFIVLSVFLFVLSVMQVPAEGLDDFIKDENISPAVRVTRLIIAYPIAAMVYILSPLLQIFLWSIQFFFNCFAFATSLGKSGWANLIVK